VHIDPRSDRPLYQQIADQLRIQIRAGTLGAGQKLPSERELTERYDTTHATVRAALRVLTIEGLAEPRKGVGVFVRERGPIRRMSVDRFARRHRQDGKAAMAVEVEREDRTWRGEVLELGEVPAPAAVAARLEVREGEPVFVRRRRMWIDDQPTQFADSYFKADMVSGTRITEEDSGPGGVYARLEEAGHKLTRFTEELAFRMPTPEEARGLHLGAGVPVVDLVRVAYAGDEPVEVFLSVLAGDKHVFQYEFDAVD
jgi:GntR family transcriptional regulator